MSIEEAKETELVQFINKRYPTEPDEQGYRMAKAVACKVGALWLLSQAFIELKYIGPRDISGFAERLYKKLEELCVQGESPLADYPPNMEKL